MYRFYCDTLEINTYDFQYYLFKQGSADHNRIILSRHLSREKREQHTDLWRLQNNINTIIRVFKTNFINMKTIMFLTNI